MFDISGLVKIDENVDKCKCQIKTKDFVQELAPGITSRKIQNVNVVWDTSIL